MGKPKTRDCEDYGCQPLHSEVRLIKVVTPNGRIHVMMTSLLNTAALYHSRWRIEKAFKRLKHRLAQENTFAL